MKLNKLKETKRMRKRIRTRKKVRGTPGKPRLAVFKSLKHFYCQLIDDEAGRTLLSSSTLVKEVRENMKAGTKKTDSAKLVGKDIAAKAAQAGIKAVVFDRGGFKYHGRIKAMADAAREAGLKF